MRSSILIVDDKPSIRTMLRLCLQPQHRVVEAAGVKEALARLADGDFDLALVDLRLTDGDGMQVLAAATPGTAVIIMTAFGSIESAVQAMRDGAIDYLQKPFTEPQVTHLVERIVRERSLRRELVDLRAQAAGRERMFPAVESAAMKRLMQSATRAAASDANVLIAGESGSGKGALARFIHQQSARRDGPFVVVELAGIAESELFGQARGGVGRLESALGGTLLLDEIGEVPLPLQLKLLRLSQEGEFERVGESVPRRVEARILATTHRDLRQMVAAGTFREDLYYRLKVVELEVPSLRTRRDDILPLAEFFLARAAQRARRRLRVFSPAAREILTRYPWPGNVRELRNSIERAAILADGDVADADLFAAEAAVLAGERAQDDPEGDSIAAAERRHIARVIAKYPTMEEAARALGIDTVTLWRRRKKYRLD